MKKLNQWYMRFFSVFLVCVPLWACGGGGKKADDDADVDEMMDDGGAQPDIDSSTPEGDADVTKPDAGSKEDGATMMDSTTPMDASSDGGNDGSMPNIGNDGGGDAMIPKDAGPMIDPKGLVNGKNPKTAEQAKAEYGATSPVFSSVSGGAPTSVETAKASTGELFPLQSGEAPQATNYACSGSAGMAPAANTVGCISFHRLNEGVCNSSANGGILVSVKFKGPLQSNGAMVPFAMRDAGDKLFYSSFQGALLRCIMDYGLTMTPAGYPALCKECYWSASYQAGVASGIYVNRLKP